MEAMTSPVVEWSSCVLGPIRSSSMMPRGSFWRRDAVGAENTTVVSLARADADFASQAT